MKIALPSEYRKQLVTLSAAVEPLWYAGLDEALAAVPEAVAVWYHLEPGQAGRVLEAGPALRWLTTVAAGMDRWPLERFRERRLLVTNGAGIAAIPIAEYTVACMLAACRGLEAIFSAGRKGQWDPRSPGDRELFGSTALIVGYGHIGQAIGDRLRPFGVEVTGVKRRPDGGPGVIAADRWRERLGEFDWVILANPLTGETRHQIGVSEIAAMRAGAWIVNIARGGLIDDDALLPALRAGRIGGAILDAFVVEPLPPDSDYWRLQNVIVTPHISWKSNRSRQRAADLFLANLDRFLRGEALTNIVDLEAGY